MKSLVVLLAVVAPLVAHADNKSEADALFKKAKKLHAEKRYPDACPMFEKSDSLDPGIGAKLNTAKCYEDWGMLARAYRWYSDAYDMAVKEKDDRADKIKALVDGVDSDVPKLTIKVPDDAPVKGADIRLDGKPADVAKPIRVDPGPHEITWYVDGKRKTKTIPMERGGETETTLDFRLPQGGHIEERVTGTEPPSGGGSKEPVDTPERPGRTRRIVALSLGGAGVVGLGVATYLTLSARSSYNDAIDSHCMGSSSTCDDEGLSITHDARTKANIATAVTVVSLGAIGTGVWLYLTAPKGESREKTVYVTPLVDTHGGGLVVGGGF
jgi:hypothetical protein